MRVSPAAADVAPQGTQQFSATVQNAPGAAIEWRVIPGDDPGSVGSITASGLYTAPPGIPDPPTVTVSAALRSDPARFDTAQVTVVPPLRIRPPLASVTLGQPIQLEAIGPDITAEGVTWSATGGTVSPTGLYAPPDAPDAYTVTATSMTDPSVRADATIYVTDLAGNFSWRSDAGITGQNTQELALTPTNVASGRFGKLFSCSVDGYVHAQPLYVAGLNINFAGTLHRNVVFVATAHNSIYAFNADAAPCQQIWKKDFLDLSAGITSVPSEDVGATRDGPEIGITGTPVIDPVGRTIYFVAKTKENGSYVQRLHALDIRDGTERLGSPVRIEAAVAGTGDGSDGNEQVSFLPLQQNQRAALQLAGGKIYVAFGGHGDKDPFHGWLFVYDAADLTQLPIVLNTTPDGSRGGIWQGGAAPSVDANGHVFVATGDGSSGLGPPPASRPNYGNSVLRLASPDLSVSDSFTPHNELQLRAEGADLGSTGVVLLPDQPGTHPRLALIGSEDGILYLLDRDSLGGHIPGGPDAVISTLDLGLPIFGTPAYWQGTIYVAPAGDHLMAFPLNNGALPPQPVPASQSADTVGALGASPMVSSDGAGNGVVWIIDAGGHATGEPAVLRAYDAGDLFTKLYDSSEAIGDAAGPAVRFAVPTVANGTVYVGTQNELTVYGLLP